MIHPTAIHAARDLQRRELLAAAEQDHLAVQACEPRAGGGIALAAHKLADDLAAAVRRISENLPSRRLIPQPASR